MADFYAWTTICQDGRPSLVGAMFGDHHAPLCAMSLEIVADPIIRTLAREHVIKTGQTVTLQKFTLTDTLETLRPQA
jgi:hypothetical protein